MSVGEVTALQTERGQDQNGDGFTNDMDSRWTLEGWIKFGIKKKLYFCFEDMTGSHLSATFTRDVEQKKESLG